METTVRIGSLTLKNPVTVASGTAGYGEELTGFIDLARLGAIFTKGLSMEHRPGNRGNRVLETPSGVLNSIGLENVGLRKFISEKLPFLSGKGATVIPNVAGHSVEENVELCRALSSEKGVSALELNVSCPNVKEGGMAFGTDMNIFTGLLEKTRRACACPLIIKLSPNGTDIASFALRAQETGADAVSAVNTFLGMKIDIETGRPHFLNIFAGLSGPAIRPLAVRAVFQIYQKVTIPVIGMGRISSTDDALEFMMAGASAVSIGTMGLVDPSLSTGIIEGIEAYMTKNRISSLTEIPGLSHR